MKLPVYLLGPTTLYGLQEQQHCSVRTHPRNWFRRLLGIVALNIIYRYEKPTEQNLRAVPKYMTSRSQFKALIESQPSLQCSSSSPELQPTINHLVNSSTVQPVHGGIPIAIPNYGTIQSVVINVYNNSDSK